MAEPAIDLTTPRRIHVVGVGGAGMCAIASVLVRMGHRVTGSDLKDTPVLAGLRARGVEVHVGHRADHLPPDAEALAVSTAVTATNAEVVEAIARGVPVFRRAQVLAAIASTRRTVAVAGTHGKTTTSSMLALVLREAGLRPSFIVGGDVNEIGSGAAWDDGELLVVEADESDGTFLELPREAAVVTNIEPDHLGHYGGFPELVDAFDRFLADTPGPAVVCADDPVAAKAGRTHGALTYGVTDAADVHLEVVEHGRGGTRFRLTEQGRSLVELSLPVPGLHNASNAAAALLMGALLGAPFDAGARALARFAGVARRFQFRGEHDSVTFVDDYAHLPSEVKAALATARDGGWRHVVCVFQPHRYSRTAALWADFADAFVDADRVVITDVYAAGETPSPGVTGRLILNAVLDAHPASQMAYLPRRDDQVRYVRRVVRPGDVCLTLGAGDVTSLPDVFLRSGP